MLEQVKYSSNVLTSSNPQDPNILLTQKNVDIHKKKKQFKIKKSKMFPGKKNKLQQIFLNPLYEGLQNQDNLNQSKSNFGPWIPQTQKLIFLPEQSKQKHQTHEQINQGNLLRSISVNDHYLQRQIINAINVQADNPEVHHLPQIKPKKQLHELKFSSLILEAPKYSSLFSLKIPKNKQMSMTRSRSHNFLPIGSLRYESMKYLPSNERYFQKKTLSRPNNVIYNYCCSGSEINPFTTQLQSTISKIQMNKNLKSHLLTKFNGFNRRQNPKIPQSTLSPFKKTISQQLYDDLIRKKNKGK